MLGVLLARCWDLSALCECVCVWLTLALSRAELAGKSPALARHLAAATLGLGGVESFGNGAFSCLEFGEAETLSGICRERGKVLVNPKFFCSAVINSATDFSLLFHIIEADR